MLVCAFKPNANAPVCLLTIMAVLYINPAPDRKPCAKAQHKFWEVRHKAL